MVFGIPPEGFDQSESSIVEGKDGLLLGKESG